MRVLVVRGKLAFHWPRSIADINCLLFIVVCLSLRARVCWDMGMMR